MLYHKFDNLAQPLLYDFYVALARVFSVLLSLALWLGWEDGEAVMSETKTS